MGRLLFLGGLLALAGCATVGDFTSPSRGEGGAGATPTACAEGHLFDSECSPTPLCCVKGPTAPFEGPSWFAIGAPDTLAACPSSATEGLAAYAGMKKPPQHTCGACSCSPAACTLPEGIHTNAAPCADADGSIAVPLGPDPAAGWTGACSDEGALPANLSCFGEPCAQSVTVPAMPVAACAPETAPAEPFPDPTWGTMARQCVIDPLSEPTCADNEVCMPELEGLVRCLHVKAEHPTCPPEYPRHEVFYQDVEDKRGCTLCKCSDPSADAQCMALFQVYSDATCGVLEGAVVVTDQEAACFDVVEGTALGSFEASVLIDTPGSCTPSGGEPFGGVRPAEPLTLCCQGDPEAPG